MSPVQHTTRRTVTSALAWSVPAVAVTAAAPAVAASPSLSGCATFAWTGLTGTSGTGGQLSGSTPATSGTATMTVTQSRTSGQAGNVNGTNFDFARAAAGSQRAEGNYPANSIKSQGAFYSVPTGSTTSVLTLNQGSSSTTQAASETLTFTFASTPTSVTFNIYDITSITGATRPYAYNERYTDKVTFGGISWFTVDATVGSPSAYTTTSTSISGTGDNWSTNTGNYVTVTVYPTSSSFTLTYTNAYAAPVNRETTAYTVDGNFQYIGLGDVRACY
ncbi:hypothetical protein [Kytococcus sedentarius]|uniref:hypothetical protein n=1 Tax=Kytococcus sedentarius TaxID=1276 RepID=UPI0019517968|nr:hypothetical protein [Kytococcus sedentarius]QRO87439.1 hypothetical protein I6J30_00160 [Kytococcus sedentarius]